MNRRRLLMTNSQESARGLFFLDPDAQGNPTKAVFLNFPLNIDQALPYIFYNTHGDNVYPTVTEVQFIDCDDVTSLPQNYFQGASSIVKVVLPPNITSISNYLFFGCKSLNEIEIPDSVLSIGPYAFQNCTGLTELTLSDSLTSIGDSAFQNCTGLTELTLSDSLTSIGVGAFACCTGLTELTLPASLTSIGSVAFYACSSLTNLTLAQGFNCNGLNVSDSTRFTAETIVACLEALADRTGETAYTLTIGSTNINKLTSEQIAIATNKNWNLA